MARLLDPVADLLLVGDFVGMVLYGFATTLPVTLEMMIAHGGAVMRGSDRACVIVDLPWGSYQHARGAGLSQRRARAGGNRRRRGQARGRARDGGDDRLPGRARHLPARAYRAPAASGECDGISRPRPHGGRGGSHLGGRAGGGGAGAFAVVVEGTAEPVARALSAAIEIPTIGIGASPACDGQILVTEDMLGLFGAFKPRFVKRYADLAPLVAAAAAAYAEDVRARRFPGPEHVYAAAPPGS